MAAAGPRVVHFPVHIPSGFAPADVESDGTDVGPSGKPCPGCTPPFSIRWGGGMHAVRIREGRKLAHRAIDIMAPQGAELRAIGPGTVAPVWKPGPGRVEPGAGNSPKGGNYVVIHDGPWRWYFAHLLDTPLVKPGEHVEAGQLLGYVGRTGNAVRRVRLKDGRVEFRGCPHLHLALTALSRDALDWARKHKLDILGDKVDPVPLLRVLEGAPR